jgi:hypothetical protein
MIRRVQLVNQQYQVMVRINDLKEKKNGIRLFLFFFLESKTTVEIESDEQDENSLPKSKRMKREEDGKILFFLHL